jgi:hypothetical protein
MNKLDFSELVAALKGGASKDARFKPAKPGNFDGARDRKLVDAWLAEMEDYLHATKVGRHSTVELAKSYLKGYAATWWRTMKQEECRNPSFGLVTKVKGLQSYGPRERKPGSQGKGIARVRAKSKETWESRQEEAWESHHILSGMLESVREYEGVNPHTPKATPTLGDGVPMDSQNFRERLQGSKLNGLWRSLYH